MNITFWIAIIGCLTGVISLCFEIARHLSEKPKVHIGTFNELCNKIRIDNDIVYCYLHLRIMNTGKKHVLLTDVYMRRPGTTKSIRENLLYYKKALSGIPWRTRNNLPVRRKPDVVHLPASIPAGGVFEVCFLFTDFLQDCYQSEGHFVFPTLCVGFATSKVKEYEIQAILSCVDNDDYYVDQNGNKWKL